MEDTHPRQRGLDSGDYDYPLEPPPRKKSGNGLHILSPPIPPQGLSSFSSVSSSSTTTMSWEQNVTTTQDYDNKMSSHSRNGSLKMKQNEDIGEDDVSINTERSDGNDDNDHLNGTTTTIENNHKRDDEDNSNHGCGTGTTTTTGGVASAVRESPAAAQTMAIGIRRAPPDSIFVSAPDGFIGFGPHSP